MLGAVLAATVQFPAQAIDLRDAVARALSTSPDVGIVVEERRATDFEVSQANGLFLPTVDLRTTGGEEYNNGITAPSRVLPRYEAGLTLRQLLFDGEESKNELAFRSARQRSASHRVLETSQSVALDAVEAYLEALRNRELVALAEETVEAHEQTLAHVLEIAQGGAAGVADVKQAESRLARAEDDYARARNRLHDADAVYRRVIGESVTGLARPDVPEGALPRVVSQATAAAVAANPAVKVAKSEVAEADAMYRKSKSNFWPRVNFEVAGNSSHNLDGARGSETDISALLTLNYNLYRGGSDIAKRQAYIARLAKSRQQLNRAIRTVEEQARLSWNALRNGRDRVTALRNEVNANQIVRATYREQFDLNQRSLLDLLDSENDLFIAKANLITSEFTVMFGTYRVLATTGDLLAALNVAPPPEADADGMRTVPVRQPTFPAAPAAPVAPKPGNSKIGPASTPSGGQKPPAPGFDTVARTIAPKPSIEPASPVSEDIPSPNVTYAPAPATSASQPSRTLRLTPASPVRSSVPRLKDRRADLSARSSPIGRASPIASSAKRMPRHTAQ